VFVKPLLKTFDRCLVEVSRLACVLFKARICTYIVGLPDQSLGRLCSTSGTGASSYKRSVVTVGAGASG
jgi:hypothetical protein